MSSTDSTTEVGSYFISNYPPFSMWNSEAVAGVRAAMESAPLAGPLGLYLHIPFCRKRCKFCYFRVYTDKRADEIETYMAALAREIKLVSELNCIGDREFRFVYFGGGTPSFLSVKQLHSLVNRLRQYVGWDNAEEVTFECEPGTLSQPKVQALQEVGVTRLSLGVENFNDEILSENGRAHQSAEIFRSWEWIQAAQFPNVNIDLIAGMVGENWDNWKDCVRKTIEMSPESVTIYQMELPFNTIYSRDLLGEGNRDEEAHSPVADWPTKRAWVGYAFDELQAAGYHVSSAYTVVKDDRKINFSYRDNLWQGADLLATGVASFGHFAGWHYQNQSQWNAYLEALDQDKLPISRALKPTANQMLIREMILQLKRGHLDVDYFRQKFGEDIIQRWRSEWSLHRDDGYLTFDNQQVNLTREGLLRVDSLLPVFFEPAHQGARYT